MKRNQSSAPIDFVITWVDGNDPAWNAERKKYITEAQIGDNREIRFRDWGTLIYWFRSVEKYAPWVNKIYFITAGHIPSWLNTSHPKLEIVRHADYIPAEFLPTFNSHTIELNFHRIRGLSEQFVYFNDDVFLNAPVKATDFFKNGLPRETFALNTILFGPDNLGAVNGNNLCIINKNFSKKACFKRNWYKWLSPINGLENIVRTSLLLPWPWFPGFLYKHTTSSFLKTTLNTLWERENEVLKATCSCRFRQQNNVNQWLFKFWQMADGKFIPISDHFSYCYHIKDTVQPVCKSIERNHFKVICINDTGETSKFNILANELCETFSRIFPNKSTFER